MEEPDNFDKELEKAAAEIKELIKDTKTLTVKDIHDLRNLAKSKTDIYEENDNLSNEQKAWKAIYYQMDQKLEDLIGSEEKSQIDSLEKEADTLGDMQSVMAEKLEKDGDDSLQGKALLFIGLIGGIVLGINFFDDLFITVIIAITLAMVGVLFSALIMKNSWASSTLAIYLYKLGNLIRSSFLIDLARKLYSDALKIKNTDG